MFQLLVLSCLLLKIVNGGKVVIERMSASNDMGLLGRSPPDIMHEVVFIVQPKNMDKLEEILMDISSPNSPNTRQWLELDEVRAMVQNEEASNNITNWLTGHNITINHMTPYRRYITATANISTWEYLFDTEFYQWKQYNEDSDIPIIVHRSNEVKLPERLSAQVLTVYNTCQVFPRIVRHGVIRNPPSPLSSSSSSSYYDRNNGHNNGHNSLYKSHMIFADIPEDRVPKHTRLRKRKFELEVANTVTVSFLDSYYYIPTNYDTSTQTQSVFQTNNEMYSPTDLTQFQNTYGIPVKSVQSRNGNQATATCGSNGCSEGNLDLQYIMGISRQANTIFWYIPNTFSDPFLEYLMEIQSESFVSKVNSISWGANEAAFNDASLLAFNNEMAILSAAGVTVVASSGDDGVARYSNNACQCNSGYYTSHPATSPYVTAVGATMGITNVVPNLNEGEEACSSRSGGVITSGGGFAKSARNTRQSWQNAAVQRYFSQVTPVNAPGYVPSGRGYPDVSLLGTKYEVIIDGVVNQIYGTSASAPVFGGMITLLNTVLTNRSKPLAGFLNPYLYNSNASSLWTDITIGDNRCCRYSGVNPSANAPCCNFGYSTAAGWDPVTGLGSIIYPKLALVFNETVPFTLRQNTVKNPFALTITLIIIIAVVGVCALLCISGCVYYLYFSPNKATVLSNLSMTPRAMMAPRQGPQTDERARQTQAQVIAQSAAAAVAVRRGSLSNKDRRGSHSDRERRQSLNNNNNTGDRRGSMNQPHTVMPQTVTVDANSIIAMQNAAYSRFQEGHSNTSSTHTSGHMSSPTATAPTLVTATPIITSPPPIRSSSITSASPLYYPWSEWSMETKYLQEMGFTDQRKLVPLLHKHMKIPVSKNPNANGMIDQANMDALFQELFNE